MGKGKKKETAYSLFVKEFRKKTSCSFAEAYTLAASQWEKMNEHERKVYVDEAHRLKGTAGSGTVSKVDAALKKEEEKKHAMREDITSTINSAHNRVSELNFYLIHINEFFYVHSEARYFPAEVGLARFSLQDGLKTIEETNLRGKTDIKASVYHAYCDPGKLPTGYAGDVQFTDHKLPYPNRSEEHRMETRAEQEIFQEIVSYLSQDLLHNQPLPPVYTSKKYKDKIVHMINWWLNKYGYEEDYIKVYNLEDLFSQLNIASGKIRNENNRKKGRATDDDIELINGVPHAELLISKDYFDFTPGIACEFHELSDVINACSKSFVIRWVYLICNYCCNSEDMVSVQHMPKDATVKLSKEAGEGTRCG